MKILNKSSRDKKQKRFKNLVLCLLAVIVTAGTVWGVFSISWGPEIVNTSNLSSEFLLPDIPAYAEVQQYERDSISYLMIRGYEMLLVNRTYHLPSDYGNGLTPETRAAYNAMAATATVAGHPIWIQSGYRSYWTQADLFVSNVGKYGSEEKANLICARAGQSEHQAGLALDLAGSEGILTSGSPTGQWVSAHCAEYGFILRYPEGKTWATGYVFEPWHFRYVGVELAQILTDSGLSVEEYAGLA